MSNSAANAINYSDHDDEVSLEAEELNDISVASSDDSNDNSGDGPYNDNNRVTEEAVFLHDTQDIQNRTSRSIRTAAMEDRRFCSLFGVRMEIVIMVWDMLGEGSLRPEKSQPKHLLWTLYFLKVYPREGPGCSSVGGSKGAVDTKTLRKWVWLFLERISKFADKVVSFL
jgi:hypothetical protein